MPSGGHYFADHEIDVDEVTASGGALAPRDPSVSITTGSSMGEVAFYLTPEEAQDLAQDLLDAAEKARRDAGILGEDHA